MIRHITESTNVHNGIVIDAMRIRHGSITAGKIQLVSALIDPSTHLNLDYRHALIGPVVVAEKLEPGAEVLISDGRFVFASVRRDSFRHYGWVNVADRAGQIRTAAGKFAAKALKGSQAEGSG